VCNLNVIRTVKSVNNSTTLVGAAGSALYRMPQNTLVTGYTYVAECDGVAPPGGVTTSNNYTLNSSTGVVGSDTGYSC